MKLTIVLPSDEYRSSAGARIRYSRIVPSLSRQGIELTLESIARFQPETAEFDAVVFSKTHDARSLVAAALASRRGKLVGVDLFDDYFSDRGDSRLARYQSWLSQLIEVCDFALCSTESMRAVVHQYRQGLATHVLNDPAPDQDFDGLSAILERKHQEADSEQRLRMLWFGVGDNPIFRVGLSDLAAHAWVLSTLARGGMTVDLTVLTNRRALTAAGLSLISQLPVPVDIKEWSEAEERRMLREAFVAFLPVNAKAFSAAKSLNRAITALSAGCQVISVGYPLYAALDPLIYHDPRDFMADLQRGALRVSARKIDELRNIVEKVASREGEGRRLAVFLRQLHQCESVDRLPLCLIHGHSTMAEAHDLVRSAAGLSVASPFCSAGLDFDVIFRGELRDLKMLVSKRVSHLLLPHAQLRLKGRERLHGKQFLRVSNHGGLPTASTKADEDSHNKSISFQLAIYTGIMREIEQRLSEAFGHRQIIISENSQLPFQMAA